MLTDLFHFSARDLARIERPLTHHILPIEKDTVEGKVTMKFDGVWYWKYISVPRNHPDLKGAYSDALMEAMAGIYRSLPLSEPFRPWHWHEFDGGL